MKWLNCAVVVGILVELVMSSPDYNQHAYNTKGRTVTPDSIRIWFHYDFFSPSIESKYFTTNALSYENDWYPTNNYYDAYNTPDNTQSTEYGYNYEHSPARYLLTNLRSL